MTPRLNLRPEGWRHARRRRRRARHGRVCVLSAFAAGGGLETAAELAAVTRPASKVALVVDLDDRSFAISLAP